MSRKFEIGQLVRFCGDSGGPLGYVFPDDGAIGVVTDVLSELAKYPYSVRWFLSRPRLTEEYADFELAAVEEIEHV
jgi:hypothetical protein